VTKLFSLSVVCPDSHLHDVMSLLETLPVRHITARPIPVDLGLIHEDQPAQPKLIKRTHAAPESAATKNPGGRGVKRPSRSDPAFYAMGRASQAFFDTVTQPFTTGEFDRAIRAVSEGRPFQAASRLAYYLQQGKLRKTGPHHYEVVK